MHLPDGFLGSGTSSSLIAVAAAVGVAALSKIRKSFFAKQKKPVLATPEGITIGGGETAQLTKYGREKIFKMATVGAFVFSAQMINFPVANGTSGHLLGGVLAGILLGPLEAMLVLSSVLVVQSLFFADGGLVALGANIFNMGVIGAIGGYYLYRIIKKYFKQVFLAAFFAAWISVVLASAAASVELAISGTIPLNTVLPAMTKVHLLIGIGEGIITVLVLGGLKYKEKRDE
ncbi:MAG: cobalamin biosynthesis protein CbiM [Candidatus Kerfeldbacteria bacterium CG08_land_8_20_14_0_20_40_16]|uniref:Cobalamin biosynthesis protein CbiM n=1 Tax=Candidatus Kerfeldbacteria bacterium CG08_land_8_20_14_0_20_40_16 TaxID=2014244 RepID=A0A2H0YWU8_9BACT|nr:MAG: cobalamin biosynthesis protein CbiM [Candidatus Kerfeldbacteria bacterium CG08_land_8_20_14_0_20_40_16]